MKPAADNLQRAPMTMTLLLLPLVYGVAGVVLLGDFSADLKAMVAGQVMGAALGSMVQYWLGSSNGSARKTDMIEAQRTQEKAPE
jgi:membrane protein YqaA with SNARE-associated domain